MVLVRKLALVLSIVFCGSLALAAAVVAAGGGLGPGVYAFSSKNATATFGTLNGGPPSQGFSVSVDRGLNSFRPKDPKSPRTVVNNTIVSLSLFDDAGNYSYGCFIIDPADFTVSQDLQSARVHTTLTADEICPGFGAPVTGKGAATFAGGGGGGTALPLPISIDIIWTGMGVTSTGSDRSHYQCLAYSTQFNTVFNSANASASGRMSAIAGSFETPQAVVGSFDSKATIKGVPDPACFPQ